MGRDDLHRLEAVASRHPDVEDDHVGRQTDIESLHEDAQEILTVLCERERQIEICVGRGHRQEQAIGWFVLGDDDVERRPCLHGRCQVSVPA